MFYMWNRSWWQINKLSGIIKCTISFKAIFQIRPNEHWFLFLPSILYCVICRCLRLCGTVCLLWNFLFVSDWAQALQKILGFCRVPSTRCSGTSVGGCMNKWIWGHTWTLMCKNWTLISSEWSDLLRLRSLACWKRYQHKLKMLIFVFPL